MQEFSLLYPQGVEPDCKTLCEEAVNDLSLELICEKLADDTFEHNIIKNIMIKIERNPAVIRFGEVAERLDSRTYMAVGQPS